MYLNGKYYIWSCGEDKDNIKVEGLDLHGHKLKYIEIELGYWRKANAIHRWFVDNIQDGIDDCKEYYVNRERLEELLVLCKEVLDKVKLVDGKVANGYRFENGKKIPILEDGKLIENQEIAEDLLPTQGGFFFGSTDYDEYYFEDIKGTVNMLEKALELPTDWEFYYSSSW